MPENPRAEPEYVTIRPDTLDTIDAYVRIGRKPGGFVQAVLENDLYVATMRADVGNRAALHGIAVYVHAQTPPMCHGSPERFHRWLKIYSALAADIKPCRYCGGSGFADGGHSLCRICTGLGTSDRKWWPPVVSSSLALAERNGETL